MTLKDEYIKQVEQQIEDWKIEIAKLKTRAAKLEAEARTEFNQKIQALESKHQETVLKFKEIKEAGEESWEDIIKGYEKVRREMNDYIEKTIATSV